MLGALGVSGEHIPAHAQDRSRMFISILAEFAAHGRRVLVVADNVNTGHQAELLLPTDGVTAAIVTLPPYAGHAQRPLARPGRPGAR